MPVITVYLKAVDGFSKTRKFKTLKGAQRFAQDYVGETPDLGRGYAVSWDGVGRIMVQGVSLRELFPKAGD
jgi:hypothetical protein